eukprot:1165309-Prorocentrum_minimum.AAC.6
MKRGLSGHLEDKVDIALRLFRDHCAGCKAMDIPMVASRGCCLGILVNGSSDLTQASHASASTLEQDHPARSLNLKEFINLRKYLPRPSLPRMPFGLVSALHTSRALLC